MKYVITNTVGFWNILVHFYCNKTLFFQIDWNPSVEIGLKTIVYDDSTDDTKCKVFFEVSVSNHRVIFATFSAILNNLTTNMLFGVHTMYM